MIDNWNATMSLAKKDHRHAGASESRYVFVSPESLMADFLADVGKRRRK